MDIIGPGGKFSIDRCAYDCQECSKMLRPGDPCAYLSATTLPVTLNKTETVMTMELAKFVHRLRQGLPGIGDQALAAALTTETALCPGIVRGSQIQSVLQIMEGIQGALANSECRVTALDIIGPAKEMGAQTLMASDGFHKLEQSSSQSKNDFEHARAATSPETNPDDFTACFFLSDALVQWLMLIDNRKEKTGQEIEKTCESRFKKDDTADASTKPRRRSGLVTAVSADGTPVVSILVPLGQHERYIYHWVVFVASKLRYPFSYGSFDVACKFVKWRERIDAHAEILQNGLLEAARENASHDQGSLLEAISATTPPSWLALRLEETVAALKDPERKFACKDNDALATAQSVASIWKAFVYLLEVFGGITVDDKATVCCMLHSGLDTDAPPRACAASHPPLRASLFASALRASLFSDSWPCAFARCSSGRLVPPFWLQAQAMSAQPSD